MVQWGPFLYTVQHVTHKTVWVTFCCIYTQMLLITEKYTTHKIHTKLHPGLKWHIFHTLTSDNIDDIISHFFMVVYANSREPNICITKRKLYSGTKIWD